MTIAPIAMAIARSWKNVALALLLAVIVTLKLSLAAEQRHSARLQLRLAETDAAYERFKADVAAKTALAKAQDAARVSRVERDQMLINQERLNAYQKDIAALRARAAQRLRDGQAAADSGRGRDASMPGLSGAAGGAHGAAGEVGLSDDDALIASEIALRLKALQQWVQAQQRADNAPDSRGFQP